MIRINLLPHREERRKERRQQFFIFLGLSLLAGAAIGLAGHLIITGYIESQENRNNIFKAEIAKLDKDIAEIQRLQEQIDSLLARKKVIESLQSHRAETVHLFNDLAKLMPEGVVLKSLKQSGLRIELRGQAQSNARVSTLMRSLDSSAHLEKPQLVEVKAGSVEGRRVGDFTLIVTIERPKPPAEESVKSPRRGGAAK
jgi:type IV pilus assembly protein PilN